jgi:hypothetical protein
LIQNLTAADWRGVSHYWDHKRQEIFTFHEDKSSGKIVPQKNVWNPTTRIMSWTQDALSGCPGEANRKYKRHLFYRHIGCPSTFRNSTYQYLGDVKLETITPNPTGSGFLVTWQL